ncbi:MAG: chorismate synthase [Dehalococcoidia bacterium]|nr:chorismate synthase [Dehalococcoidia bacterium]
MGRFRFLTAGESHGKGLVAIIEGMPAGVPIDEEYIAHDMKRRQGGYGRGGRMKIERDRAEIISGVRHGLSIGSPLAILIANRDWENWKEAMAVSPVDNVELVTALRPGHADLAGVIKYGFDDIRPILERASARETAARVALGAVCRSFLLKVGIEIHSHTLNIGGQGVSDGIKIDWESVETSPVRCADSTVEKSMIKAIDEAKAGGDTLGGIFEVIADGVPVGLGSHVHWDRKLDGILAQAMMSINAVKGVEIGMGFSAVVAKGSQVHDVIEPSGVKEGLFWKRSTNRAGGVEGGISNGESLVVRCAVKPIPTLTEPLPSIDLYTGEKVNAHVERSDVCIVPAAGVVGEAMMSIVLADAFLDKFGGDHLKEIQSNYRNYLNSISVRE